jgi:lysozyme
MLASQKSIELIKKHEGYKSNAYLCPSGVYTIGWGCTFYSNGKPVNKGDKINREDAEKLLLHHTNLLSKKVSKVLWVSVTQNQFDALISFVFNVGFRAFKRSKLLAEINAGNNVNKVEFQFFRWIYDNGKRSKGLWNRRFAESQLYRSVS